MKTLLDLVREKRDAALKPATDLIGVAETEQRDLTADEFTAVQTVTASDEVKALDARIAELVALATRNAVAVAELPKGNSVVKVRSEPLTYGRGDRRTSYFRDLGMAHVGNDPEARNRLSRHRTEMDVEIPAWEARIDQAFERSLDEFRPDGQVSVQKRDISRVDGAGGEFVPPLWIMQEYAELARAGRVSAGLIRNIPLPGGTDSISVPRITTGSAAAIQTADNAAVQETDMVTNSATGPVRTIAGQQDIALQLLEQSPIMFDEIVFADLTADYNSKLDLQILNGSGAAGQHTGFLQLAGTNADAPRVLAVRRTSRVAGIDRAEAPDVRTHHALTPLVLDDWSARLVEPSVPCAECGRPVQCDGDDDRAGC
jgi:HK97 family phage major capsid protein